MRFDWTRDKSFLLTAILFLASRLILLTFNKAELTDGYILAQWSVAHPNLWHPIYPLLMKLGAFVFDPMISGRIVSALSGLVCLFLVRAISLRLYDEQVSRYACILFAVSPLIVWLNTRVFADSLFLVFVLGCILAMLDIEKSLNFFWCIFLSGLGALTRPDALLLIPVVVWAVIRIFRRGEFRIGQLLAGIVPWAVFIGWKLTKSDAGYESVMGFSVRTANVLKIIEYGVNYIDVYPYVLFYPVAFFALYHLIKSPKSDSIWKCLLIYFHVAYLVMLGIWWAWQTRFLQVPLTLLLVEAAAGMVLWEKTPARFVRARVVNVAIFVSAAIFALVAFFGQVDVFADIEDSSRFLAQQPQSSAIYSDEQIKVGYVVGRSVALYDRNHPFKDGDLIALHSFYTPLQSEAQVLAHKYKLEVIHVSNATTLPILGNIPVTNTVVSFSNQKVQDRFQIQSFQSVVFRVHQQ